MRDPSDFAAPVRVTGKKIGRFRVLQAEGTAIPNTMAAVLQSHWWNGALVTTYGLRRDEVEQYTISSSSFAPRTDFTRIFNPGALNGVATWLRMKSERTIKLQGYTDKTGSVSSNQALSERRAQSVRPAMPRAESERSSSGSQ